MSALRRFARNRLAVAGAGLVALFCLASLAAPLLPLAPPNATDLGARLLPPFAAGHLLGTDQLGRDMLSRLLWGARVSIAVGVAASLAAAIVGSVIGIVAGFHGRATDGVLMRGVDILMAFPYLLLALAIVAALGPGLLNALLAISVVNIPFFARTVRGATLGLAGRPFVDAARLAGRSRAGLLFGEILPNVLPVIVVTMSATVGWMILETAGLSFLGLGAQPPQADLGSILGDGYKLMIPAPHVALMPGLAILLLVMGVNLTGDGLRDSLDPRLASGALTRPAPMTALRRRRENGSGPGPVEDDKALLTVSNLSVEFATRGETLRAVREASFAVARGECLGIVGESGSGKTVGALSLLRLVASPPGLIADGRIRFDGEDLLSLPFEAVRRLRGGRIGFVFQDPASSLNPVLPVGRQIAEAVRAHRAAGPAEAMARAVELLSAVEMPDAAERARAYPHELSGGQRQRVGIAMALANDPDLLIADEPTTALDVTVQAEVLRLLDRLRRERGLALIFITHDIGVASELCDRVAVMRGGRVVEEGPVGRVLGAPEHDYTRALLAAVPHLGRSGARVDREDGDALARIEGLSRRFGSRRSVFRRTRRPIDALDGIDMAIREGEVLGIVGESGSGKTTLGRLIAGLDKPSRGGVHWSAEDRPKIGMVFQDPGNSLNPRRPVRHALRVFGARRGGVRRGGVRGWGARDRDAALMEAVDLDPALLDRYPHELSGGQAQRVAIARALAAEPEIVVLDEPTSALDVSVQDRIMALLRRIREERGLTYLLISHDLGVVDALADRVVVLKDGRIVESGARADVLAAPREAYTKKLLASVPVPGERRILPVR